MLVYSSYSTLKLGSYPLFMDCSLEPPSELPINLKITSAADVIFLDLL